MSETNEAAKPISEKEFAEMVHAAAMDVKEKEPRAEAMEIRKTAAQKEFKKVAAERNEWLTDFATDKNDGSSEELRTLCLAYAAAEKKAETEKAKWQAAKSLWEEAKAVLNETAMAIIDPQQRLKLVDSEEQIAEPPATEEEVDIAWRAMPIKKLKLSAAATEELKGVNVETLGQLDDLIRGNNEEFPGGLSSDEDGLNWSVPKSNRAVSAFYSYLETLGVPVSQSREVEETSEASSLTRIRVLRISESNTLGLKAGDEVDANLISADQAQISGDSGSVWMSAGEFEVLEPQEVA